MWFIGLYTLGLFSCVGMQAIAMGWGLLNKIHVKFHVNQQGFSNMAFDWLVAVLPAYQEPGLKIFVN